MEEEELDSHVGIGAETALSQSAPIDISVVEEQVAIRMLRKMIIIRTFEDRVLEVFRRGQISGTLHLSHGEEACAVGVAEALHTDDWITITHRGHGQALAKGVSARSLMAELFGEESGCCRARGGSMHVGDVRARAL